MRSLFALLFLLLLITPNTAIADEAPASEGGETASHIVDAFTDDEKDAIKGSAESFTFQAEVSRLMDIIINSLYTQKAVFLRELISNAADALEKARFISVTEPSFLEGNPDLEIRIEADPAAKTLTIQDTGIGMTKDDLINNLGTVARSGTTNFLEALAESGDLNLIGQFGVGFYSAFLVADRVTVTSKNNNDPDQHIWESTIGGSFTVAKDPRGNTLHRGTRITLHLKDDSTDYLDMAQVKDTVMKYNQFVNFPITMLLTKDVQIDVYDGKKDDEDVDREDTVVDETDPLLKKKKTVKKTDWEVVNSDKPIWMRPKENITDDEYQAFYTSLTRDTVAPLSWTHFTAEGEVEFKSILYIPGASPFDGFATYFSSRQESVKLYARRVLVADALYDLLPKWLSFTRGVVDSDDLPLKVDRENLSQSKVFSVITNKLVGKFLDLIRKLSREDVTAWKEYREKLAAKKKESDDSDDKEKDDDGEDDKKKDEEVSPPETKFAKFWKAFSKNIKVGCVDDDANRSKIVKVARYHTTVTGPNEFISLDEYVSRMPETQKDIYYIANDNFDGASNSPHLQIYKKKNIEVLILTDPLDEPCMTRLRNFDSKPLVSVEKGDVKLDSGEDAKKRLKKLKKAFEPLTAVWSKVLSEHVKAVRVTTKLVEDPAVITTATYANSAYGDRVARSQTFGTADSTMNKWQRHLDVNPNHPLIKKMLELAKEAPDDAQLEQIGKVMLDAALLSSGFVVDDPAPLSKKLFKLLQNEMGVASDAVVEEYELSAEELADDEDDKKKKDDDDEDDMDEDDDDDEIDLDDDEGIDLSSMAAGLGGDSEGDDKESSSHHDAAESSSSSTHQEADKEVEGDDVNTGDAEASSSEDKPIKDEL